MSWATPLVSIGVPVYNGGSELRRALETLLTQTYTNLQVIISDNASTDETEAICREFAARDVRVVYHRNETNQGAVANFEKVLHLATGEFFMWAAHDDWWHPEFVAANLAVLLANPDAIASISRVVYMDAGREVRIRPWVPRGTAPLLGPVQVNLRRYIQNPGMNTRMYSVYRREVLLHCLPFRTFSGADWAFVVRTLAYGKYAEVPMPLMFRGVRGESSNAIRTLRTGNSSVGRVLPMWPFTREVLQMPHVRIDLSLCLSLAYINLLYALVLLKARIVALFSEGGR